MERPKLPPHRISRTTAALMVTVALFFDGLQLAPKIFVVILGPFGVPIEMGLSAAISAFGYFTMWLWFKMSGVSILEGRGMSKKFLTLMGTMLAEVMPLLNILPGLTTFTIVTILLTRREDERARATMKKKIRHMELLEMRRKQEEARAAYEAQI